MGGRGSQGGTRSTYRGDSTRKFNLQQQKQAGTGGKGGGGGGGKGGSKGQTSSNTGGIQTGGGNGSGGGSVADTKPKEEGLVDLESQFEATDTYGKLLDKYGDNPAAFDAAYAKFFEAWKAKQKVVTPAGSGSSPSPLSPFRRKDDRTPTEKNIYADAEPVNRKYFDSKANRINCQRCTTAYETRRRGYDVVARPVTEGYKKRTYNSQRDDYDGAGASFDEIADMWVDEDGNSGEWFVSEQTNRSRLIAEMEAEIRSWGEGARGFVGVQWNESSAHIFNVEVRNGKIIYIDTQRNLPDKEIQINYQDWKQKIDPTQWQGVMRVDNLNPTDKVQTWVREQTIQEKNAPSYEELLAFFQKNQSQFTPQTQTAFYRGWDAIRKGNVPTPPREYRNNEELLVAFEEGIEWAKVPE